MVLITMPCNGSEKRSTHFGFPGSVREPSLSLGRRYLGSLSGRGGAGVQTGAFPRSSLRMSTCTQASYDTIDTPLNVIDSSSSLNQRQILEFHTLSTFNPGRLAVDGGDLRAGTVIMKELDKGVSPAAETASTRLQGTALTLSLTDNNDNNSEKTHTSLLRCQKFLRGEIGENVNVPRQIRKMSGEVWSGTGVLFLFRDRGYHLNFEDPKPSQRTVTPPSAPSMSASMAMEPGVTAPKPAASGAASGLNSMSYQKDAEQSVPSGSPEQSCRAMSGAQVEGPSLSTKHRSTGSSSYPPTIHLSGQDGWQSMIAYDACVPLGAWARGCPEAPEFLQDECSMLRESFGLQQLLLQPYEELKRKGASKDTEATAASKPKRNVGKLKNQGCTKFLGEQKGK